MFNDILVLAPHTDDGEIGCGGSIAKFIDMGSNVHYVSFTLAEESVPNTFPKDILLKEVSLAVASLGITQLTTHNFPVRNFSNHRQEILDIMIKLNNNLKPDLVFMPSTHDIHQDHKTISEEGLRAFKHTSILGYEMIWNNINFSNQCFISIQKEHLQKKIDSLKYYESQKKRYYFTEEFIKSLAITRGTQIDKYYAEVFEVIRWVM